MSTDKICSILIEVVIKSTLYPCAVTMLPSLPLSFLVSFFMCPFLLANSDDVAGAAVAAAAAAAAASVTLTTNIAAKTARVFVLFR